MKKIDSARAVALLREAVAEKGTEYVYPKLPPSETEYGDCAYFHPRTGSPSCIVGHALAKEGVTLGDLTEYENEAASIREVASAAGSLIQKVEITERAILVFAVAQREQDTGSTWGTALLRAAEAGQGTD